MLAAQPPPQVLSMTDSWAETDRLIERELEAEICQRFIRLSCEKMLNARHERGGAKLHRNLLILHLLRKARSDSKKLPYECANLLKRCPIPSTTSAVTRHLSAGAVSPPQDNTFLSEAEVEHDPEPEPEPIIENTLVESDEEEEDVEIDVVSCDDDKPIILSTGTPQRVPTQEKLVERPNQNQATVLGGPLEYKVRDQDSVETSKRGTFRGNSLLIGHMTGLEARFEPLHLPFMSNDAIEEATDVASLLDEEHSQVPELSDDLDHMISPPISPPDVHKTMGKKLEDEKTFALDIYDFEDSQPPQLFSCQEESDPEDDSGAEDDCELDVDGLCKRRKRKTSTPRVTSVAEKRPCTTDGGDSDSGVDVDAEIIEPQAAQPKTPTLISVYSTGLGTTVVPPPAVSTVQPLADQTVPVLKRSYSLFCK